MIEVAVGEETRGEGGEEDESLHSAEDDDAGREDCILGYFFSPILSMCYSWSIDFDISPWF